MTNPLKEKLKKIYKEAEQQISNINSISALEQLEIKYLGRKSELTELLKSIKNLPAEQKPTIGKEIQITKQTIQDQLNNRKSLLLKIDLESKINNSNLDLTFASLPPKNQGSIHLLSQLIHEIEIIFSQLGFSILDGPEIESEFFNFDALNVPNHHPARDIQDTFFIKATPDPHHGKLVLRTHTSNTQVRSLLKHGAPLKAIFPGRVFRFEATDATHDSTFYQVEGMLVDKNINLSSLKSILNEFLTRLFQKKIQTRYRPGYFPFTEPSLELDILWTTQTGKQHWLELMGAGMIHPKVLKHGKIDPKEFQGWAFGFGLDRLAMIKYNINDIRHFYENDLRFLKQF